MSDKIPMTIAGKVKLEAELKRLLTIERPAIIKAIEEARAHGDISENADYDAAKERQALTEGRIAEVQSKIASSEVVDVSQIKADNIVFGATVTIEDLETEEELVYQIVGVDESDVKLAKISILSPLARALIGKKVGDVVVVNGPKVDREFEVLKFEYK